MQHHVPQHVRGCVIQWHDRQFNKMRRGVVLESIRGDGSPKLRVCQMGQRDEFTVYADEVSSGFAREDFVCHVPTRHGRGSLGIGQVISRRTMGGREQLMVDFLESRQKCWLPYERLKVVQLAQSRFVNGHHSAHNHAERWRLRVLSILLQRWQENTGAFSQLEIDPLPHQIHLVHHILRSGHLDWMLADDVGLGKTIEVGMLLSALLARQRFERILIVTPASLTRQWQDELSHLFNLRGFRIYGDDFHINQHAHWFDHRMVIGSIDRLKQPEHLEKILAVQHWDLVVFDEAHRLTRHQYGNKLHRSQRYKLAQALRQRTDHMMLLTATPHQGKRDSFVGLLDLLKPQWSEQWLRLNQNAHLLEDFIYRNRKIDVTDADGQFIFHGMIPQMIQLPSQPGREAFAHALEQYVTASLKAAALLNGTQSNAIGFVMTIFRKLAASSFAAILRALKTRRDHLDGHALDGDDSDLDDLQEGPSTKVRGYFFEGEQAMLDALILMVEQLHENDLKVQTLQDHIIAPLLAKQAHKKVLIFTEFRGTQDHLQQALGRQYGSHKVGLIHGGQKVREREQIIDAFCNGELQFLISTEAGGEGLNLQKNCHVMVNYDLPWNPMRMVQRIGRLYRYGQTERVLSFNLCDRTTVDARVVDLMYRRLDQVVRDMSGVSDEFDEQLHLEIMGHMANLDDVATIINEASIQGVERTTERINEAIERAKQAQHLQGSLLEHAQGFDANALQQSYKLDRRHLWSFVRGMLDVHHCEVIQETHKGQVVEYRLSEAIVQQLGWSRQRIRLTVDRQLARRAMDITLLDINHPLLVLLFDMAQRHEHEAYHTTVLNHQHRGTLVVGQLRWQNEFGQLQFEEVELLWQEEGQWSNNPEFLAQWLLEPVQPAETETTLTTPERRKLMESATNLLHQSLSERAHEHLHPDHQHILGVAQFDGE